MGRFISLNCFFLKIQDPDNRSAFPSACPTGIIKRAQSPSQFAARARSSAGRYTSGPMAPALQSTQHSQRFEAVPPAFTSMASGSGYSNTSFGFGFNVAQHGSYVAPDPLNALDLDALDLEMWWNSKVKDGFVPHPSLPFAFDTDAIGDSFRPNTSQPQNSYESSHRRSDTGTLHPPMHLTHRTRGVVTEVQDSQRKRIAAEVQVHGHEVIAHRDRRPIFSP
jgi:hypothetical protein